MKRDRADNEYRSDCGLACCTMLPILDGYIGNVAENRRNESGRLSGHS
jgi:hypothetical protein